MIDNIKSLLINWNSTKNERQKLQHSYIAITVIVIFVAGVISLFNAKNGHRIVFIALFSFGAYLANAVVWNLIQSSISSKIPSKPRRK